MSATQVQPLLTLTPVSSLRVLVLEDNADDAELMIHELEQSGFTVSSQRAQTREECSRLLHENSYDVVLADYNLPQWKGMEAMELLRNERVDIPLILVTGTLGDVTAVECIKQGATDYVLKHHLQRLPISVRRALKEKRVRDQRTRAEQELAQKVAELARSNQELEQFAYVASHDLQEPLRMVATYTQLLAERYRGKLDEHADKYIRYAVDGAKRMQIMISDLLTFSRVSRGEVVKTEVDCNLILERVQKSLQGAIAESHAIVTADPLPVVESDGSLLQQVFQNLIGNAIKFRRPKEPPEIHISASPANGMWEFAVLDNGMGFEREHLESVFVIFKRLHTPAEYPGSGIGLALCKKIVERHGGRIWADSDPGKGSTFRFTLPMIESGTGIAGAHGER